jgi:hypothetical protein
MHVFAYFTAMVNKTPPKMAGFAGNATLPASALLPVRHRLARFRHVSHDILSSASAVAFFAAHHMMIIM